MFYHAYDNYMEHAFPHDELKPLSATHTDSLAELGNAKHNKGKRSFTEVMLATPRALYFHTQNNLQVHPTRA